MCGFHRNWGRPFFGIRPKCSSVFLGRYDDASFFFVFEPDRVTSLDRDYLASIPPECAASSYVIYADTCLLSDEELRSLNITFKKIPRDITRL